MRQHNEQAEMEIMEEAKRIHAEDVKRAARLTGGGVNSSLNVNSSLDWNDLPGYWQAHYVRRAARVLGLPAPAGLEVA